jgi:hypothetical protein
LEQVLGTAEAKARNGAAGALEEDARLTALFLWTMETTDVNENDAAAGPLPGGEGEQDDDEDEDVPRSKKKSGLSLPFDVVRRIAQPLGIHIPIWEHRIIEVEKGVVRLLPVHERAQQLFGEAGASVAAMEIEGTRSGPAQLTLFPDAQAAPTVRGRRKTTVVGSDAKLESRRDATTLDRVHAAMLLQSSGHTNALRRLLEAEQERSPDFLRLANALSALYPRTSDEKRLLDAMLLAVPR